MVSPVPNPDEENKIVSLYESLLERWNQREAGEYAALFEENSTVIGFDGSSMRGSGEIAATLSQIFTDHQTSRYVWKVREVRFLSPEVALLHAVVGMLPPGGADLNPAVNAVQTLTAVKRAGRWRIAYFQNTPAQYHGRPDLSRALTEELRPLLS